MVNNISNNSININNTNNNGGFFNQAPTQLPWSQIMIADSSFCHNSSDYSDSPQSCSPATSNYQSDMNDSSNPYLVGSPSSNFSDGSSHVDEVGFWQQTQQQQQQQQQQSLSSIASTYIQPSSFINCTTTVQSMVSEVTEISNLSSINPTFGFAEMSSVSKDITLYLKDV